MKSRQQTAELAALLASRKTEGSLSQSNPYKVARDTLLVCKVAASAQTIAVNLCNGALSQELFEHKKGKLLAKLKPLCGPYSVRFMLGGDPRGPVLRIHNNGGAPIAGNTWGGDEDGYGI